MHRILIALILFIGLASAASATDLGARERSFHAAPPAAWRYNRHSVALPFPRSRRAQSVWASGACWSGCQSYCTWGEASCLQIDAQGRCLKLTDTCDRYCQRACRTTGGPLAAFLE